MESSSLSENRPSSSKEQHAPALPPVKKSLAEDQPGSQPSKSPITTNDPNIVVFDGPGDPEDPQNWPDKYKYLLIGLLSAMQTMVNLGTLMSTPAVPVILQSLGVRNNDFYTVLLVAIWELGEACGTLVVAPMSEYFGRLPVYHAANILFTLWTIASALSQNVQMLIAFRFLTGLSVASVTLDATVVGDMFPVERRGTVQSILGIAPLIGPVFGPTIGGAISESISGTIELGFVFFFRETYKVAILQRKTKRLCKETGNEQLRSAIERPRGFEAFLQKGLIRPARMICLSPVLVLLAIHVSVIFAYLYILLTTMTAVFERNYGFSTRSAGFVYIGIGLGMVCGMFCCRYTLDRFVKYRKAKSRTKPEDRLVPMVAGGVVVPIGLLVYGWTAQMRAHWMLPVVGLAICGFSVATTLISSSSYLVDAFGIYAASAIAAIITLRCVAGVVLPLAGPALFAKLGLGWGTTLLALVALAFIPIPIAMMRMGERIRNSSKLQIIF
ncbi:MFS general substrate transporter [Melanomma pulvis-pyrius CBS 109.77]|uniref:MFS general substrate transporter n=1 Tax=Melanomma pulvis-pyrius CBS 109.77 TaxID=1314802 RepID=A0A6A6WQ05_9PLEO|nr:MFS general substrate transporter [Melanomma pulvis-pyrius CBS 109.77]